MMRPRTLASRTPHTAFVAAILVLLLASCGIRPLRDADTVPSPEKPAVVDRAIEDRILAMDPASVSQADVRNVLAKGPTPRIILMHGGIFPVHLAMESFGIAFSTFQDGPGVRTRGDAYENPLLCSPNLVDLVGSQIGAQFLFDNLCRDQQRQLA